jgi:Papain-like cysteine protease AvrRpt2
VTEERRLGAGGYWQVLDECDDPSVVKQFNADACAAACGEMLVRDRISTSMGQRDIVRVAGGVPMEMPTLAIALNRLVQWPGIWIGAMVGIDGATDEALLQALCETGSWAAGFWEDGAPLGHVVVVDGLDEKGWLFIRDPWGQEQTSRYGSRYRMGLDAFLEVWSRQAVYFAKT